MLKKSIKYTNFDGEETEEVFYFNLSKTELIELEVSYNGGLSAAIKRIVDSNDTAALIREFKRLILTAYGVKSDDGKRFIKNDQLREEFVQTAAYEALFMEIAFNSDAAAEFVNGIVPADLRDQLGDAMVSQNMPVVPLAPPPLPAS